MDLVQRLVQAAGAEVTVMLPSLPKEQLVGAMHLGEIPMHLRGVYMLLVELSNEPSVLGLDMRSVSRIWSSSVQTHFQEALDKRRENGGGSTYKILLHENWQAYVLPLNGVEFQVRGMVAT